jgi:threonyl-tRNA synthetase
VAAAPAAAADDGAKAGGRTKTRLTKESGERAEGTTGKIGGPLKIESDPSWLAERAAVYDEIIAAQRARLAAKPKVPIKVTLPDGGVKEGVSWVTTPLSIAEGISKGLAGSVVVAKVSYTSRVGADEADGANAANTGPEEEEDAPGAAPGGSKPELWDLTRPLEGDCHLQLLKFDDKEGKMVFWHSSAHVLGECLECAYGGKLCIGPPTEEGFYYDAYMGDK